MELVSTEEGRTEKFPVGMRVLAVDDNPTCLGTLEELLLRYKYHVTKTTDSKKALQMIREKSNMFDLVITNAEMPDIDGFKLLETGLAMDLPVIKAVPKTLLDLMNIEGLAMENVASHLQRYRLFLKRATEAPQLNNGKELLTRKKHRVFWSPELHEKFLNAYEQLGRGKAFPKQIHALMNVEGLTRHNVACHLQKYILNLKRNGHRDQIGTYHDTNLFQPASSPLEPLLFPKSNSSAYWICLPEAA